MQAVLDIGIYTENVTLTLIEAGKYFILLVFCVLAIRLWRRWARTSASKDIAGFFCALVATLLAAVIGYFSMRQSLGSMYSYYGMKAFRAGLVPQALSLFQIADDRWHTAETTGQKGVCLMLLGDPDRGRALIAQARILRQGDSQFEDFYEGVFLFIKDDVDHAAPLLEAASGSDEYHWSVIKIFAVINLDANRQADAVRLMQPFMQVAVTEPDQAYVLAALQQAAGKKDEARALLDQFPMANPSPKWQNRYAKLRAQLGN